MARNVEYWKKVITDAIAGSPQLAELNNTSAVAVHNLFAYAIAYCAWTLDVLFDSHTAEVKDALLKIKPHTLSWYREKALRFRFGQALISETDKYSDTGLTAEDILAREVVKHAAVTEAENESRLVIKIAGESAGVLQPITTPQYDSFVEYFKRVKDAGVLLTILNNPPDKLFFKARIFYDPLILNNTGTNILTGGKPVEDAFTEFMKELPFNGELILMSLVDKLQKVEGVVIPSLDEVSTSYLDPATSTYGSPVLVDVKCQPRSGYFTIENFVNVQYLPYV